MAKQIRLVSDLKVLQEVAERRCHKTCFFGRACRRIRAHPDAIHASPTGGLEALRQVSDHLHRPRVVISLRLAHDLAYFRMLWLPRIGRGFPVRKLAGVASEAQNASGRKRFELENQAAVLRRKETPVRESLHFLRQADKIDRHVRTSRWEWRG